MAQSVATQSFADRIRWNDRIKPAIIALAVGGLGYLIGAYWVAPRMAAQQPHYVPAAYAALPSGAVTVVHADGTAALLPVRIADTSATREVGFRNVGEQAFDNTFLLYGLTRETTARTSYAVEGIRAPIEFAAISAEGTVVSITQAPLGTSRVSIAERHQYLLAAKAGTLERFGVAVGSTIDPEGIVKF
jgi:uncharacterized membrane protein (UPF0127 family)